MQPSISLIVSTYNQAHFAPIVLESILSQDYCPLFEVLICDDGSDDGLPLLLETLPRRRGRVVDFVYIRQDHSGFRLSKLRNLGIKCARSPLLVFIDGDTWIAPTFLRDHVSAHCDEKIIGCGIRSHLVFDDRRDSRAIAQMMCHRAPAGDEQRQQIEWFGSAHPWMACVGGNFSVKSGAEVLFDENFESWGSEDRDLSYRLFQIGRRPVPISNSHAIHLSRLSEYQPLSDDHLRVEGMLFGKLYLRSKYPDGEMKPAFEMVRGCYLDTERDQWHLGKKREDVTVDEILDKFRDWYQSRSIGTQKRRDQTGRRGRFAG